MMRSSAICSCTIALLASPLLAQRGDATQASENVERSSWFAEVSHRLRHEEYRFSSVPGEEGAWSAPNRAHEFRIRVSADGVELVPRTAHGSSVDAPWKLALATKRFGRAGHALELSPASVTIARERVELDHGPLTEWFVNDDRGLEQGWTIATRPLGVDPLWIGLEITGDLSLRIDDTRRSAILVDSCGEVRLRYRDLVVFDANGHELPARIASSPNGAGIEIDDAQAAYPLTVDPVLTGPAWTQEGNQSGGEFGHSTSTAGDVNGDGYSDVIVGARFFDNGQTDEGRAFVYLGSPTGLSTTAAWTAEPNSSSTFGYDVALAGDVNGDGFSDVIVGAPEYLSAGGRGAAFVYLGSSSGLSPTPAWSGFSAFGPGNSARYGERVDTAGDVNGDGYSDVIVGAPASSGVIPPAAYVYLGSATGLSTSPAWSAIDNVLSRLGRGVGCAGDVNADGYSDVIVGAPSRNNGPGSEGRAYLYLGSASGLATTPAWTKDGEQSPSYFGTGVATAGDVNGDGYSDVVVGSSRFTNAQVDEGRAYLYLGSASGLATSASWTTEADHPGAEFGASVTTAGDVNGDGFSDLLVSAYAFDVAQENDGKVLLYLGAAAGLSTTPAWTGTSAQNNAQFGIGMGPAGDVNGDGYSDVIIGAGLYDNGQTNEGRAFVYMGSASGLASISATTVESDQSAAGLGASLASAGDVNGDGYSDVIVGAPYYDNGESDEGGAFVYMGSAMGLSTTAAWTSESNAIDAHFGQSVATAGDVNGDGFSDVIVGAEQYTLAGAAFVFLGSGSGLAANASWMAIGQQNLGEFGRSVASAGDVNGDGFGDVIVGANAQPLGGRAFVYFGSASGLAASANWSAQSDQGLSHFGFSVASAGDVNGDGNSDVIVGANLYTNGQTNEGRAFVYHGSRSGLSSTADWTAEGNQAAAYFGLSVRSAGDVNGDGFSDVIVGAPHYSNGESMEGRAYVYLGSSQGLSMNASWTAEGQQSSANFGVSAASAGDVNGDGYSDAIVGSNGYDNDQADEGRAFVYLGSASGLSASAAWTAESNQVDPNFGMTVATAGDVNGDGYSDVIVGAYTYDGGQVNEGRTFLYLGNEGRGGWTLAPQQRQANDAAPIDLLGRSSDKHEFRIRLGFERETTGFAWASGVTPTARLEWEVRPLGTPFDGTHIKSGADQTITGSPLTFNELAEFHSTPNPALTVGNNNHTLFDARLAFHWRARVRTNNPLFPVTPWVSIPWNNVTEAKLRAGAIQRKLP